MHIWSCIVMSGVWKLVFLVHIHLTVSSFNSANDLRDGLNVTIVSSPKLGEDTICVNQSVSLTCRTGQQMRDDVTWYWQDQSKQGSTIAVVATRNGVVYTCKASDNNNVMGEANVTVVANGTQPAMSAHFNHYMLLDEGSNVTLTIEIITNLLLSNGSPSWNVSTGPKLPKNAVVNNYTIDGFSSLTLYDLSFHDDTGNYTCTASNQCGTSSEFVYIDIRKAYIKCNDSGRIIKPPQDVVTVSKQDIHFKCLVQGNLRTLDNSITSYWKVEFPPSSQREPVYIVDNSTDPYRIAIYPTCETCCNFTSQQTILSVPAELDGTTLSCVEHLEEIDPVTRQSTATLTVLNTPKIISSDSEVCAVENDNVSLHCLFNAATMDGVTVVVWLKDNLNISGYDIETGVVQGKNNEIISTLHIRNFTHKDQGEYTCYCYYNQSLVTSHKVVTSDEATMLLKANCPAKEDSNSKVLIVSVSGVGVFLVVVVAVILFIIAVWNRKKIQRWLCDTQVPMVEPDQPTTHAEQPTDHDESTPLLDDEEEIQT